MQSGAVINCRRPPVVLKTRGIDDSVKIALMPLLQEFVKGESSVSIVRRIYSSNCKALYTKVLTGLGPNYRGREHILIKSTKLLSMGLGPNYRGRELSLPTSGSFSIFSLGPNYRGREHLSPP